MKAKNSSMKLLAMATGRNSFEGTESVCFAMRATAPASCDSRVVGIILKKIRRWAIALLCLSVVCLGQTLAQTPNTVSIAGYQAASRGSGDKPGLRSSFFHLGTRTPSGSQPLAFSLRNAASRPTANPMSLSSLAAANLQVLGSGTIGRLTKWTGFTSSNSFIGDSTIFESKTGLVGIGTDTPTARLTVAGTIQSLSGGFQFPDGTVQTTASIGALTAVIHDTTLMGNGTTSSPLGVAVPLVLSGPVSSGGVIQATNTAISGLGVTANGGVSGDGMRARGGNGSTGGGSGVFALGGFSSGGTGGTGVRAVGGDTESGFSGIGLTANGGRSELSTGGNGLISIGGPSDSGFGGGGIFARGGLSNSATGGVGLNSTGGDGSNGGKGVVVLGGSGNGAGNSGGIGIEVVGGLGMNGASPGLAGKFFGDVEIAGNLNVTGTKNFKIDHPLDPANKYLVHAAIESAEVLNVYSGNITTDKKGEAIVQLPDWFEAINRDLRYQLTVIGTFAQAMVAEKVRANRFIIRTNAPNVEVSWQVTGVRSDAAMHKHPFQVEQQKLERERGTYLNPEAFDQPEERGVEWTRHPELMRQLKERRQAMKRKTAN